MDACSDSRAATTWSGSNIPSSRRRLWTWSDAPGLGFAAGSQPFYKGAKHAEVDSLFGAPVAALAMTATWGV
jgi:hypothetical protein